MPPNVALQSSVPRAPKCQVPTLPTKQRELRFRRQTRNLQGLSLEGAFTGKIKNEAAREPQAP